MLLFGLNNIDFFHVFYLSIHVSLHVRYLGILLFINQSILTVYLFDMLPLLSFPKNFQLFFFDFLLFFFFLFLNFYGPFLVHFLYLQNLIRSLSCITNFLQDFCLFAFQHVNSIIEETCIEIRYFGLPLQMKNAFVSKVVF